MSPLRLSDRPPPLWLGFLAAALAIAVATATLYPLKEIANADSLGVVYIPGVLLVSTVWGLRLGVVTAIGSGLAFNFFHLPPVGQFDVSTDNDLVGWVLFLIVAIASGSLANSVRARAAESERRRREADRALAELAALEAERERMQAGAIEAGALRRSDELKTALLRAVSHDLRTR